MSRITVPACDLGQRKYHIVFNSLFLNLSSGGNVLSLSLYLSLTFFSLRTRLARALNFVHGARFDLAAASAGALLRVSPSVVVGCSCYCGTVCE